MRDKCNNWIELVPELEHSKRTTGMKTPFIYIEIDFTKCFTSCCCQWTRARKQKKMQVTGAYCIKCKHYTVTFCFMEEHLGTRPGYSHIQMLAQQAPPCAALPLLFSHISEKHSADEAFRYLHLVMPSQIAFSICGADKLHLDLMALSKSDRETV